MLDVDVVLDVDIVEGTELSYFWGYRKFGDSVVNVVY